MAKPTSDLTDDQLREGAATMKAATRLSQRKFSKEGMTNALA